MTGQEQLLEGQSQVPDLLAGYSEQQRADYEQAWDRFVDYAREGGNSFGPENILDIADNRLDEVTQKRLALLVFWPDTLSEDPFRLGDHSQVYPEATSAEYAFQDLPIAAEYAPEAYAWALSQIDRERGTLEWQKFTGMTNRQNLESRNLGLRYAASMIRKFPDTWGIHAEQIIKYLPIYLRSSLTVAKLVVRGELHHSDHLSSNLLPAIRSRFFEVMETEFPLLAPDDQVQLFKAFDSKLADRLSLNKVSDPEAGFNKDDQTLIKNLYAIKVKHDVRSDQVLYNGNYAVELLTILGDDHPVLLGELTRSANHIIDSDRPYAPVDQIRLIIDALPEDHSLIEKLEEVISRAEAWAAQEETIRRQRKIEDQRYREEGEAAKNLVIDGLWNALSAKPKS